MRLGACFLVPLVMTAGLAFAQPRPVPAASVVQAGGRAATESQQPPPQVSVAQPAAAQQLPTTPETAPTEAALGLVPGGIYPGAQFLTSYDAGQGQRYYLFGLNRAFEDVVAYYRALLKDKGDRVFDEPPVHEFDIGKFREDTMAFPPSVTIKDYTWGGLGGYLNPKLGAEPQRFKTILQIVPAPAGAPAPRR